MIQNFLRALPVFVIVANILAHAVEERGTASECAADQKCASTEEASYLQTKQFEQATHARCQQMFLCFTAECKGEQVFGGLHGGCLGNISVQSYPAMWQPGPDNCGTGKIWVSNMSGRENAPRNMCIWFEYMDYWNHFSHDIADHYKRDTPIRVYTGSNGKCPGDNPKKLFFQAPFDMWFDYWYTADTKRTYKINSLLEWGVGKESKYGANNWLGSKTATYTKTDCSTMTFNVYMEDPPNTDARVGIGSCTCTCSDGTHGMQTADGCICKDGSTCLAPTLAPTPAPTEPAPVSQVTMDMDYPDSHAADFVIHMP